MLFLLNSNISYIIIIYSDIPKETPMLFTGKVNAARISGLFLVGIFLLSLIVFSSETAAASKKGPVEHKGKLYFFNTEGEPARSKKERTLSYEGKLYYVLKDGRIRKGWNVIKDDLYYFSRKNGAMLRNTTVSGITLLPDGKAQKMYINSKGKKVKSLDVSIRTKCIKVLKKRGVYNKSKSTQLRSAWNYLTNRKTFHYSKRYPNLSDPKWTKKYADYMLSAHCGNCYGFACTFSAFAWTIGYDPYVVAGRCPGGRDRARDGFTRHCVARINGRWYDPEYWAIYRSHYLYGAGGLSYTFKNRHKAVRFKKVKGTVKPAVKTITGKLKKVDGKYYLFNSSGRGRKGVFYIGGKLYNFKSKGKYGNCMTKKSYRKYQKAAKKGSSFAYLEKLIGKSASYNDECDMYSSRTYLYKYIAVNVRQNESGKWIINEIFDRKDLQI